VAGLRPGDAQEPASERRSARCRRLATWSSRGSDGERGYVRGMGPGLVIALVVVDVLLLVAAGATFRRRRGSLAPYLLALAAGIVALWLIATIVVTATSA
jgi:hypothetical protein